MKTQKDAEPIGPEERFYGYLVGLEVAFNALDEGETVCSNLYAVFEQGNDQHRYLVPDRILFDMLIKRLGSMAMHRCCHDSFGMEKLWISKDAAGRWVVDLP